MVSPVNILNHNLTEENIAMYMYVLYIYFFNHGIFAHKSVILLLKIAN